MLEEVIMYTFQQCVYYISKVQCHTRPASPGLCRKVFLKKAFTPWQLRHAEVFSFGLKCPDFWSQPRKSIELLQRVSLSAVQRLGGGVWGGLLGSGQRGINGVIQGVMERGPWTAGPREQRGTERAV